MPPCNTPTYLLLIYPTPIYPTASIMVGKYRVEFLLQIALFYFILRGMHRSKKNIAYKSMLASWISTLTLKVQRRQKLAYLALFIAVSLTIVECHVFGCYETIRDCLRCFDSLTANYDPHSTFRPVLGWLTRVQRILNNTDVRILYNNTKSKD